MFKSAAELLSTSEVVAVQHLADIYNCLQLLYVKGICDVRKWLIWSWVFHDPNMSLDEYSLNIFISDHQYIYSSITATDKIEDVKVIQT